MFLPHTGADAQEEPFLKALPAGLVVENTTVVPAAQVQAIGQKLGGKIQRLSNSQVRVHGTPIQVNVITAIDEQQAMAIHSSLKKIKSFPFVLGKGNLVVECVGQNVECIHQLSPTPLETKSTSATVAYTFGELALQHDVPFVTATMEIVVDDTGLRMASHQPKSMKANPYWPSDDPQIVALAKQITAGRTSDEGKVQAILEWLTPGKNIKYSGQSGSRWGTRKVLSQKFGHCWDFSDCFVTLSRAAGVPSRQVAGWLYGSSGHVWAEHHEEGRGWQQVDPTGGGRLACGIYHIPYFTSEDGEMPIVYGAMPQITILDTNAK